MTKFLDMFSNKSQITKLAIPVLLIALYLFLYSPAKIKEMLRLFSEVSQLQADIANTKREWAGIGLLEEKILRLNEEIDNYEKKLPGEKEVPAILEYLSDSAKKLDVRITEIKPVERSEDKKQICYSVPILIKAECGYHQLGRFLNKLERADRFMKISDIKINAASFQRKILNAQLIVVTYVMSKR